MKTDITKIKIDENKKSIVVIGDSLNLTDMIEIYLYKKFNIITTVEQFDGIKLIDKFKPICAFVKVSENINPVWEFIAKMMIPHLRNTSVIAFTKENISTINEYSLKAAGIREIIKFPITQHDFLTVIQPVTGKIV